ncbi:MAG: cobalamin biosynthesis protein CobD [Rhodobacteraceae bacterium]|nr:cobalamin biosynthesis protein CobD [Paracoccaceae bacterium]
MSYALVLMIAIGLDALFGWPKTLFRAIGHPVVWIGTLIHSFDRFLNVEGADNPRRRWAGVVTAFAVVGLSAELAWIAVWLLPEGWPGVLLTGVLAWPFLAIRSLHDHVAAVGSPLSAGDTPAARRAVAQIVGRDPSALDRAGIARAALESLAENTSDGITAPVFWGLLFGLPGIAGYKALNTLDSMIGHRSEKYEAFGWASARADDLANLIPARLTGVLYALVSTRPREALRLMWRDARRHRSPNAGWPEAALAGALDIRLSGPRVYRDRIADEPWINGDAPDPLPVDIARGLKLFRLAMLGMSLVVVVLVLV